MINVPNEPLDAWLNELKKYQREQIQEILKSHDPIEAARLWISANGPMDTTGFGGIRDRNPFFDKFREEFRKFICKNAGAEEDNKQLASEMNLSRTVLITLIANNVAEHLGVMASLLVPPVAMLLYMVGKIGVKAWCALEEQEQPQ